MGREIWFYLPRQNGKTAMMLKSIDEHIDQGYTVYLAEPGSKLKDLKPLDPFEWKIAYTAWKEMRNADYDL